MDKRKKKQYSNIIKKHIDKLSNSFDTDYRVGGSKHKNIVKKNNNFFISGLGNDITVYSALMRSLDSSLGYTIESMALEIAEASGYTVTQSIDSSISSETINKIATILESYKNKSNTNKVSVNDYGLIKETVLKTQGNKKTHMSDYVLEKEKDGILTISLIELKAGGDLDIKKSRSEKEAIMEQYALIVDKHKNRILDGTALVNTYFATAYNKDSIDAGKEHWNQSCVKTFFSDEELLIGKDFWNLIFDNDKGWEFFKSEYNIQVQKLKKTVNNIIISLSN